MEFDDALEIILRDDRTRKIPVLYVIQVVMILDEMGLLKEMCYE